MAFNELYLHDECTVLVALLRQRVQLGNGIVKGVFGKAILKKNQYICSLVFTVCCLPARLLGIIEDFIVEDGIVQRQSKSDRVRGLKKKRHMIINV